MNRHERRRAAKVGVGSVINVSIGRIITKDDGALTCYACGRSATNSPCGDGNALYGAAIINDERPVPVCEGCFASENSAGVVRGGPGCLNRFSASISGASARVRLPSGVAAG